MFERFTDRAGRVVVLAQEEARMLNPNYIGTEHILLGLIHEGEGVAAATLADRYISDRYLPDKAIDLIDEAGSRLRIRRMTAPPDLREVDEQIAEVRVRKEAAIEAQDYERAARLRDQEKQLMADRDIKQAEWRDNEGEVLAQVDEEEIAAVLSTWTGIPVYKLTEEETAKLIRMEDELHHRIVDQEPAVRSVSQAIGRGRAGLN